MLQRLGWPGQGAIRPWPRRERSTQLWNSGDASKRGLGSAMSSASGNPLWRGPPGTDAPSSCRSRGILERWSWLLKEMLV
jgi:hypothetical protein